MTEQPTGSTGGETPPESSAAPPPETPPESSGTPPSERPLTFEERMGRFGRDAGAAGERIGRHAEAAANRWSRDPGVVRATDTASRIWGLIVLAIGLWFFAQITLGLDMPGIGWRDLWPIALIAIGLLVVFRGITRRA